MKREWGCIYRGGALHTNQRGYNATSSICTFTFSWVTITLLTIWKYPVLSSLLIKYPNSAGPFFQTYNDILFSMYKPTHPTHTDHLQHKVGRISLSSIYHPVLAVPSKLFVHRQKSSTSSLAHWQNHYQFHGLYPISFKVNPSINHSVRLQDAFKDLGNPKEIYLGITADDSSIVYYKISQGIVKPPMWQWVNTPNDITYRIICV